MARTAKIGTVDVAANFAAGGDTIVTRDTVSRGKRGMIGNSDCGCPCNGAMANITFRGSDKMGGASADRDHIVMTTGT